MRSRLAPHSPGFCCAKSGRVTDYCDASLTGSIAYSNTRTEGYVRWSGVLIRKGALVLVLLVASGVAGIWLGGRVPSSFLPDEDQGYLYINMQLPNAASQERTSAAAAQVEQDSRKHTWRQVHHQRDWFQSAQQCPDQLQRFLLG